MAEPLPNPLFDIHQQAGAEFQAYAELQIVSTFGEPQAEYAAIRKRAAVIDQPQRGILELSGKDRLPFLNNLLSNQTWDKQAKRGLAAGEGVYAFILNLKGRIIADVNVLELGDRTLLEIDARVIDAVRSALEKYLFTEEVKIASRIGTMHQIALHGSGALALLNDVCAPAIPATMQSWSSAPARLFDVDVVVWRDDPAGVPGYHVILPVASARAVWMNLIARFGETDRAGKRPLRPAGWAAFNSTRIEAGRPLFGIDFDDSVLPAETGILLHRAVSFTKGCYLGQEIVARMHARGQVARQIVGIRMGDDHLPIAGAQVFAPDGSGNAVGGITSSTISPLLSNAAICLGYVKKPYIPAGSVVELPAEGAMRKATVVELPFVGGG